MTALLILLSNCR